MTQPTPTSPSATRPIVVVTSDDDRFAAARRLGVELAREKGAALILYHWDAAAVLDSPLPTWWSADGEAEQFGSRLDVAQLEKAGRAPLARQVDAARGLGVDAYGWLPSEHGPEPLARYAARQGARTIVVPGSLEEAGVVEHILSGTGDIVDDLRQATRVEVVVAPESPPDTADESATDTGPAEQGAERRSGSR